MSDDAAVQPPRRRKRKARRIVLWAVLAVIVVALLGGGAFVANLAHTYDTKTQKIVDPFPNETVRPVKPTAGAPSEAVNILLLGSDTRGAALDLAEEGKPSDQRSDTMLWVHIPADRKHIYLMSIMRDTWVDIPGSGDAKINAAMAFGGVPLVVQTLEGLFKTRIDHVVIADFDGFKAITDSLGGVVVDVPIAFSSHTADLTFKAGPQKLDGDQALAFVRERYAFVDGDYQRVRDQQIFLKAVMSTVMTPATMTNPIKVNNLVNEVAPYLSVDKGLDGATVGALALSLHNVRGPDVVSFTLPNLGTGTSSDGQSIVVPDYDAITAIGTALGKDQLGAYLTQAKLG
ncbi:LCP family protein [Arthrobacter sp. ERGS1:01]|uniref:LCP family protein n=1 Tax=Arthrobacter sp. ERGS1:01 TaxID=1704044 RepID=UPI000D1C4676|nr:LCP family protein [Arthrobacter sp. ERGS1:01]